MTLTVPATATVPATVPQELDDNDRKIIDGSWCVVTLTTVNSHYTLLKRQSLVVLVKDVATGPDPIVKAGDVVTGVGAKVQDNGCLVVWDRNGRALFYSSRITSAYVLEN